MAEFLKSKNSGPQPHLIGYDLIENNVRYLREGYIDFLISQQSELRDTTD